MLLLVKDFSACNMKSNSIWEISEEAFSLVQMNWDSNLYWCGNGDGTEEEKYMDLSNIQ